jgi:hypothetical protein
VKTLPSITNQERMFLKEIIAGMSEADSWRRVFDPKEEARDPKTHEYLTTLQCKVKARNILKKKRIRFWLKYLKESGPEQMIEDTYLDAVAFGAPKDAMHAADAFLKSQFAGKEVAEIFLDCLQSIKAEIVVPFKGRLDRVAL